MVSKGLDIARAGIDRIDDQILDLLRKRAEIVDEVARAKREAGEETRSAFRPEREAAILRRLYARSREEDGPSFEGVARVWREIMSAALLQQEPVVVGTSHMQEGGGALLRSLARGHFGSGAAVKSFPSPKELHHSVRRERTLLGLVPTLKEYAKFAAWEGEGSSIFAALPFWGSNLPKAYAFGHVSLAATSDDVTLIAVGTTPGVVPASLAAGLEGTKIVIEGMESFERGIVLALRGFHIGGKSENRMNAVLADSCKNWCVLGAYARPIGELAKDGRSLL